MFRLSPIQTRALMLGLLPASVLAVILTAYMIVTRLGDLETSHQALGQSYARELAALAAHVMETRELEALDQIIGDALRNPDVLSVGFFDAVGEPLARRHKPGTDEPGADPGNRFSAPVMHLVAPAENRLLGMVSVRLADPVRLRHETRVIAVTLLICAAGLLGTAFIASTLAHRVTRPLQRLTEAVRRLEQGDDDVTVPVRSRGELGTLEEGFNAMAMRLRAARLDLENQVEQATAELMETMEALEIRNVELDLARKRALEASRAKSEFLASMSHEIRTPMNGVLGFANLLRKTELDGMQQDYLHNIVTSASGLLEIINDILDFSKLEAGKIELDRSSFKLRNCLEDAVALLVPQAHDKGLELVVLIYDDVPNALVGDPTRLRQILINLLSNAIKFTRRGEIIIRVMLENESDSDATLSLSVSDTGIGMSREVKQRLFRAFDQGNAQVPHTYGGTGLGLAITRRLAEAMSGGVRVDSAEGDGSTFTVTLTLPKSPAPSGAPDERPLQGTLVALCDSHTLSGLAMYHRLASWGAEVHRCADRGKVLECMRGDREYHVILLGFSAGENESVQDELVRQCRSHCEAPILALVSCSNGQRLERLRELGAEQCLSKPTAGHVLFRAINSLLVKQRSLRGTAQPESNAAPLRPSLTNLRVLVADDNEINLRLVAQLLASTGADLTQARNGREVLERTRKQAYDLALLDVHMPEIDGLEAARLIRREPGPCAEMPLIALTADATPENRDSIRQAGFDDLMIKPLDETQLWRLIRRMVHGGRQLLTQQSRAWIAPADKPAQPDDLPVRDQAAAIRAAGNNPELAAELFDAFIQDLLPQFDEMRQLQAARRWRELKETAHRVHGSTAYCGVPALKAAIKALEKAADRAQAEDVAARMTRLQQEIQRLTDHTATA